MELLELKMQQFKLVTQHLYLKAEAIACEL